MQNQARMLMECKNKQIVDFVSKDWKIKKKVKNDDIWRELLVIMTLPWQHQMS